MEENIISLIAETEKKALDIREGARSRAAEIVTAAEKEAMEIAKNSENECAALTGKIVAQAKRDADAAYEETLKKQRAEAAAYADGVLERVESEVAAIVGRIVK